MKTIFPAPALTSLWVEAPPAAGTVHAGGSTNPNTGVMRYSLLFADLILKTIFPAPALTSLWVEAPPAAGTVHAGGSTNPNTGVMRY
ncbi:hypothetical protein, partial [Bacillus anthracis]|uniref:hypothetical protein n=1 Tax=Bacillus anthracis TaxID=1392 RepID=UPI001E5B322C